MTLQCFFSVWYSLKCFICISSFYTYNYCVRQVVSLFARGETEAQSSKWKSWGLNEGRALKLTARLYCPLPCCLFEESMTLPGIAGFLSLQQTLWTQSSWATTLKIPTGCHSENRLTGQCGGYRMPSFLTAPAWRLLDLCCFLSPGPPDIHFLGHIWLSSSGLPEAEVHSCPFLQRIISYVKNSPFGKWMLTEITNTSSSTFQFSKSICVVIT